MPHHTLLRSLPKVDTFIAHQTFNTLSKTILLPLVRERLETLRRNILAHKISEVDQDALRQEVLEHYTAIMTPTLKKVINATGVIVHTNLGRSLIDPESFDTAKTIATAYNTLEYDLETGKRGERYSHLSTLFSKLLKCEDVLVVNNNAAAVFLVLNTFAKSKEVIVSRGELVEIGGSFRIPEVMKNSGATLVEVGATNKTHLYDYAENITAQTTMLMKVHRSNYSIEGFTSEVPLKEIVTLAKERDLIDYVDLGSGHLVDLPYGLAQTEPSLHHIMKDAPSLLSFSGDKLFGSVQAGIIVGKKALIAKLKKNQLLRMLRVDKLTLSILTHDIQRMLLGDYGKIPTLRMLFREVDTLRKHAEMLIAQIKNDVVCEIIDTTTHIGGGSTPTKKIPSIAVALQIKAYSPHKMQTLLRAHAIVGRIEKERFLLDFRTIDREDIPYIAKSIRSLTAS